MKTEIVAFTPILNAGVADQPDYDFACGVHACASTPPAALAEGIARTKRNEWIAPVEAMHLDVARGFLWTCATVDASLGFHSVLRWHTELSSRIMDVMWCIYLQPHGENAYWRGAGLTNCAVYLTSPRGAPAPPRRFPFMYGVPNEEQRRVLPWSIPKLKYADHLVSSLQAYKKRIPRLKLAVNLHRLMASVEPRSSAPVRLQLAASALETMFVSPAERHDLWESPIPDRVRQATMPGMAVSKKYFDELRIVRNDAVHRGGLRRRVARERFMGTKVLIETELILRESLKWAIRNIETVGEHFEKDSWPVDLQERREIKGTELRN